MTPVLLEREAENCLMLGELPALADVECPNGTLLVVVDGADGTPAGVATMQPPHGIVLTRMGPDAIEALVGHLVSESVTVPGAVGPAESVAAFAGRWHHATGASPRTAHRLGLYHLRRLIPPPPTPGVFRPAGEADVELLVPWAADFFRETGHADDPRPAVENRVGEGRLFLWCDPPRRVVCMAGLGGHTPNGARVNFVYTPPEYRRRGYASACVAALSALVFNSGRGVCFLFTDLDNPTPNRIYRSLGYEFLCEFQHLLFT